ncbi:MAG: hypothetical protein KKE86_12565 [Planctomycetes bacterium]|nr:hypothetical protein [Planctomycetota bacterium]MBU4400154.1 hypothetical protein [Planctomycetota bacterium]MCG2684916.1 hypothetical protein [Planctomycetales bacterium]
MNATLRENIDWVGAIDWNVRDFHGYDDEKTALIDTVKAPFAAELLRNVAALCEPLRAHWRPTPEVLDECRRLGQELADRALNPSPLETGQKFC